MGVKSESFWRQQGREGPAKERGSMLGVGAQAKKTRMRRELHIMWMALFI